MLAVIVSGFIHLFYLLICNERRKVQHTSWGSLFHPTFCLHFRHGLPSTTFLLYSSVTPRGFSQLLQIGLVQLTPAECLPASLKRISHPDALTQLVPPRQFPRLHPSQVSSSHWHHTDPSAFFRAISDCTQCTSKLRSFVSAVSCIHIHVLLYFSATSIYLF